MGSWVGKLYLVTVPVAGFEPVSGQSVVRVAISTCSKFGAYLLFRRIEYPGTLPRDLIQPKSSSSDRSPGCKNMPVVN